MEIYCDNPNCNKSFWRTPSDLKKSKSGYHFCSASCKNIAARYGGLPGVNPSLKHGKRADYRSQFAEKELFCTRCGYREFSSSVHVHHIDEDRTHHGRENLITLCSNCHNSLHNQCWQLEELTNKSRGAKESAGYHELSFVGATPTPATTQNFFLYEEHFDAKKFDLDVFSVSVDFWSDQYFVCPT